MTKTTWQPYAKAIVGGVTAGLTALAAVAADGVTLAEGLSALAAGLAVLGTVFAVPNRDPSGDVQDESVQPPEPRHADNGDDVPDNASGGLEVIPADQATGDPKRDAAGL